MIIKFVIAGFVFMGITAYDSVKAPEINQQTETGRQKQGPGSGVSTFIPTFSWHNATRFLIRCDMTGSCLTTNGGQSYKQINFPNGASGYAYDALDSNTISLSAKKLPAAVSAAFSFTGGTTKNKEQVIFYALRYDPMQAIDNEFGHTELWLSKDMGDSWQQATNATVMNTTAGIKPSYSMIACAANDAGKAYLVRNRYEERKNGGMVFWYGALKTNDAGDTWSWVWKGGGGSGQYHSRQLKKHEQ
ncbi:hypothetical protein [Agriterribacter sp.]|uniref:hypothetical protein n=1 Tax=Agriterribacter sp. TaxID=2821509 RepID=UPI002BCB48E7|nr:hypothetical protein [Agriterribacter sp.]HTN08955.1 hypothetical protein [Agriterribacter sp.]